MRHSILILVGILAISVSCTNFKEEDASVSLSADLHELSFGWKSTERQLTVSSGSRWYVSMLPSWISLESIDGSTRSPYEWGVNFLAEENDEYNREGTVEIRNEIGESIEISLSQNGAKGKYIALESLEINPALTTIIEGQSQQLSVRYYPTNTSEREVLWTSSNSDVAQVSEAGLLTAKSVGIATITARSEDGVHSAKCLVTVVSKTINVTGISLDKTSLSMTEGDTETLTATVLPSDATDKSVTWSSNNTSVALVSSDGLVTAKAAGTATITVKTNDGSKTASCAVTVNKKVIPVTSVALNKSSLTMTVGDTQTLTATVSPSNATDKSVSWSSNKTSVASVSTSGVVTAKAAGTATITVKTNDGGKTAICTVTVTAAKVSVTGVSLNKTSMSMTIGDTQTLTATITPSNATDKSVTWSSNNTSVASVSSSGIVTAKAAGTATITVKTNDGGKTATCTVTVTAAKVTVTSVSLNKTSMSMTVGDTQTLTATVLPSNADDKSVSWSSSNSSVASVSASGIVTANVVGTATITVTTNDGGKTASCLVSVGYAVPNAIDLGIGVKWGSFNLGAIKPEDSGYYYPWGYTEPMASSHNDFIFFSLDSYKWYNSSDRTLTKYCTNSTYGRNGYTDNKTVLDKEDDAAYVNLGSQWRIPTLADFTLLEEKCSWEWQSINSVNGYKVTGPNGNSIFLPTAGYGYNTEFRDYGTLGHYWSSSLRTEYPYNSYALKYGASTIEHESMPRSNLLPIRPVFGESTWASVTSVSLNKTSLSLNVGDTQTLIATITPSNATNKSVTWTSSKTSVATVSSSGVVTAKAAGTATITVTTNDGSKTATCTVTVKAATVSVTGVSLNKSSLSMTVGETQTLSATVTPSNATDKSVTWSSSNTSVASVSSSGLVTTKEAGTATITVKTTDGEKKATCTVTVNEKSSYTYVDLGLPSGLKWATSNIGASSPEEYGDYFAWGETETKTDYSWMTYKWCNGSDYNLTKYNYNNSFGTVDNKNTLEESDDIAHVQLSGKWHIPTEEEWTELLTTCTHTWVRQNGVDGTLVTGKNGKTIFLPAAGGKDGTSLDGAGSYGGYWSSSLNMDYYSGGALSVAFSSSGVSRGGYYLRYSGRTVRPVSY